MLAVLASTVVLSACGGGADLSGGGSGTSAGDGAGQGGMQKIKVSDTAGMPSAFLTYGVQRGFFKAEGLDVEVQTSAGGATVIPALLNGGVDVAGSNVVSAVIAMNRGLPIKMIGAGTSTSTDPDMDFSGILVPKDSPIRTAADLAGKKVAVNTLRNINDVVIDASMRKAGAGSAKFRPVEMPFPDMLPAIERGDVDAGMLIEPFLTTGIDQGLRVVARPYSDARPGLQIGTYLMSAERAQQDPKLVAAFQRGLQTTAASVRTDPDAFRTALPKIANFKPDLARKINLTQWNVTTDRSSVELIATSMQRLGLTDRSFDYAKGVLK
ncbi:MAG: ABC transporter substrate-binding protein [Actinomadura sp.]